MASRSRRKTPDILGDLLGGSNRAGPDASQADGRPDAESCEPLDGQGKTASSAAATRAMESDPDYFEILLVRAGGALDLVAEVLGRRRLVQWLDEMKERFDVDEPVDRAAPTTTFKRNVASWAEHHLSAERTTVGYSANGMATKEPYEVDIWAHVKGLGSQADLDIWIECRESETPTTKQDLVNLIDRACDVYHAAHTDKQEFWFDRLIMVSTGPFDLEALELAERYAVNCVRYDGAGFLFQSDDNWRLKPNWMREAEAGRGRQ